MALFVKGFFVLSPIGVLSILFPILVYLYGGVFFALGLSMIFMRGKPQVATGSSSTDHGEVFLRFNGINYFLAAVLSAAGLVIVFAPINKGLLVLFAWGIISWWMWSYLPKRLQKLQRKALVDYIFSQVPDVGFVLINHVVNDLIVGEKVDEKDPDIAKVVECYNNYIQRQL